MPGSCHCVPISLRIALALLLVATIDVAWAQQGAESEESRFPHTGVVRGRVVDQEGRPISAARIMLSGIKGSVPPVDSYADLLKACSTRTDGRGEFRLPVRFAGDPPLRITRIWIDARGFARVEDARQAAIPPGGELSLDYVMAPGEVLAGRVHPLAAGLKDAVFYRHSEESFEFLRIRGEGFDQTFLTEPGGRFEAYVPAGSYTISPSDESIRVEARTGSDDILVVGNLTPAPTEKLREAFTALWSDMDRRYSYFAYKPHVNWKKLREEFEPRIDACGSREELVLELVHLLERLEDMHVWLEVDGETIGVYQQPWRRNWSLEAVGMRLTESKTIGQFAKIGTTRDDGFGYVAILQLKAQPAEVKELLREMDRRRDAPGFLLDLRMCAGGSEPIAQRIAQWFSPREAVYAMHAYRNGPDHDDFGERRLRSLSAAASPYTNPVVCLTGTRTMSSAEAFVLMMKTLPHATMVGATTRGCSGNPKPFTLHGLNIQVWYSRWAAMDAEGRVFEDKGIAPDVAVADEPTAHYEEDPTFEKAVSTLRARVGRAP